MMVKMQSLRNYIAKKYNSSQSEFARANGVSRQQVTQWLNKDFIVVDGKLYSVRRELKK